MTQAQETLYQFSDFDSIKRSSNSRRSFSVALAVLHDRVADRILLIRRSSATDLSGWAFPGGKIEKTDFACRKESAAIIAARRELTEETGFVAKCVGREIYTRQHPKTGVILKYIYFSCDNPVKLGTVGANESTKVEEAVWVKVSLLEKIFDKSHSQVVLHRLQSLNDQTNNVDIEDVQFQSELNLEELATD